MTEYVIRGGKAGYDRLMLLAEERWPDTRALLERAGIVPGMRCIDVGCGGGEVTMQLARMVLHGGSVVGIDRDEVKLDLARRAASDRQVGNVQFTPMDVGDWDEIGGYDAVYTRFLLQHLSDPQDLLRRMWAAVAAGGVLIAEDADFGGWCCDPPNGGFEFFLDSYQRVLARRGGDHTIGRKLYRYFRAVGIPGPEMTVIQSVHEGSTKMLAWSTLETTADAVIAERVATREQVAAALASLRQFTDDPATLICGPRVFQLWSRR